MYTNEMKAIGKIVSAAGLLLSAPACPAIAHASEQGFVLLLPTSLFGAAGTAAVVATILLVTFWSSKALAWWFRPCIVRSVFAHPTFSDALSVLAAIAFFALIFVGITGPEDPQSNLLPLTIWTVFWVGVFVVQGLIFDVWRLINPWRGLFAFLVGDNRPVFVLPPRLAAWPAVLLFLIFQLFVLADIAPNDPDRLAMFALGYWVFTFAGMILFGRDAWLQRVEFFSVLFSLIGSLRPIQINTQFSVGLPGWQSVALSPLSTDRSVFCLVILASGSFDGLHETFWWLGKIGINPLEFPGRSAVVWTSATGLILANLALILVFAFAILIGLSALRATSGRRISFWLVFNTFSVAILPIALGYHFAHYFISFLVQIQYVAATLADPFARGWDLFGLASTRVSTGFLNTAGTVKVIWLTQAGTVVLSHILSVMMSHHLAGRFCNTKKDLFLIQIGISILMVVYTIFGLWLLASPRGV